MRTNSVGVFTVLLITAALVAPAAAQRSRGPGGGPAARGFSAPASHALVPRFSAPTSHALAPRFSAPTPHVSASVPRHLAPAPYFPARAPRIAAPSMTVPHFVAPRVASPTVAAPANMLGPGPAARNRDLVGPSPGPIQGNHNGPILRNPAFANLSARDRANPALAHSTFGGRFAHAGLPSKGGRHQQHLGRVIGFLGPVFWPYAYDDFFNYTFSPYAYDEFWPYAYDDVFDGIYGAYAPNYSGYSVDPGDAPDSSDAAGGTAYVYGDGTGAWVAPDRRALAPLALAAGETQICSGRSEGLADFPIQRIAQQVKPDQEQRALLDALRAVTAEALGILRAACPSDLPSTPTARLAALRSRVEVMLHAVRVIDPALQTFYRALSDEQKERLNALDVEPLAGVEIQQPEPAQRCSAEQQVASLSVANIAQSMRLNDAQRANLDALQEASSKAADILQANCPTEPSLTPTARLAQMKQRLEAMTQALDRVQPALLNFYGSLDDEQKARINRYGVGAT
jgi:hypothetical protein